MSHSKDDRILHAQRFAQEPDHVLPCAAIGQVRTVVQAGTEATGELPTQVDFIHQLPRLPDDKLSKRLLEEQSSAAGSNTF